MRLKLSATNVRQGGATVAEHIVDRPQREEALTEGIAELLADPSLPPEALALFRSALARNFTRDEAQDQILADFGLQFFAKEVTDEAPAPPPRPFTPQANTPQQQPAVFNSTVNRTPRQLIQAKLVELKAQQAIFDRQFKTLKKQRDSVKSQVEECRRLLRAPAKPKLVAVRKRKEATQNV